MGNGQPVMERLPVFDGKKKVVGREKRDPNVGRNYQSRKSKRQWRKWGIPAKNSRAVLFLRMCITAPA